MKHISLNKKLMLRNLKKFSNVNLFEEKFKDKLNNTMSFNLSHKEKNNINLPYLNSTTTNYSSMITNNDNNTIYKNKRYKKNTSNNTTITFYITETNNNNNSNNNISNNSDKNLIHNI
jgi:hypothetical protein